MNVFATSPVATAGDEREKALKMSHAALLESVRSAVEDLGIAQEFQFSLFQ